MSKKRGEGGLIQAGELPIMKTLAKKFAPPTRAQLQLIEAAAAIREQPDAAEIAYMARQLVLCTLPHSDPGNNTEAWSRRTGNLSLGIQPGIDFQTGKTIGFPYGTIPRMVLFWIVTEAVRTQQPRLVLGRSLAAFMRQVRLNPYNGRGKRSDQRRLREQMRRLFNARISFQETGLNRDRWMNMEIAPEGELWWHPRDPEQGALFESWIELGPKFFQAVRALPVPVDTRALKRLKRSPLALDLYALVCYRAFVIVHKNLEPQFISWAALQHQLGADYAERDNFKKKAQAALRKIAALYPGLTITGARGGFKLHATRLAVPQKPVENSLHRRSFPG
jgi:Plasmid encoded RepA protein